MSKMFKIQDHSDEKIPNKKMSDGGSSPDSEDFQDANDGTEHGKPS